MFQESLHELAACHGKAEKFCDYCSYAGGDDSAAVAAVARCLQCRDNLCGACEAAHRRTKVTRSHPVHSLTELRAGQHDALIRQYQCVPCPAHPAEDAMYLCGEQLLCRECKVSPPHALHACTDLGAAADKYRANINATLQKVDKKIPDLVEFSLFLKEYLEHLADTKAKISEDIEKQAALLHQMVDEHKAAMIEQLESAAKQENAGIQERKQKVEEMTGMLKANTEFIENLLQHGKDDEVLSVRNQVSARLQHLGRLTTEPMTSKLSLYFSAGTATKGNMEGIFGKVDIFNTPLNNQSVKTIFQCESPVTNGHGVSSPIPFTVELPPSMDLQKLGENVTEVACFESRGASDTKDIWPTGVVLDHDANIVVLDRDNKKVKMFHQTGKFIREFGQNGVQNLQCPYDLTVMEDGCIAVTDYEDEDIKVFTSLGVFVKSIKASFKYPRGICTNPVGQLLVVDCHRHRLTIHDPDSGTVVRDIGGRAPEGYDLFTDPYYVCTTRTGNIIVTDWGAPNLRFFDARGNFLANYGTYGLNKDQVLQPYGVCCDPYGNIFVADNQNHRIHLLAPDGTFLRFVVTKQHGLWHPMAVATDNNGLLIVTEALGKVKVFRYMEN